MRKFIAIVADKLRIAGEWLFQSSIFIKNHKDQLSTIMLIWAIIIAILSKMPFGAGLVSFMVSLCGYVCILILMITFIGKAVDSVSFSFLLFLASYIVAVTIQESLVHIYHSTLRSLNYTILTGFFVLVWGLFSMIIHTEVAQLVNHSMTTLTTIFTLVVNVIIISKKIQSESQLYINYNIAPFIITCAVSSVLVDLKAYCIKKYIENDQVNTADQQISSTG